jgi:xanthine dehydrogenase accessory factor
LRANASKIAATTAALSACGTRLRFPAVDEAVDVAALSVGEGDGADEPARLRRVVVRHGSLQALAQRRRLAELPPEPAEEADGRLIRHGERLYGPTTRIEVKPRVAAKAPRRHPDSSSSSDGCGVSIVIMRRVKEILPEIEAWRAEGERVVVATVVATRRSAPRPIGTSLAISESGKMCGSVSGGCVESDVFENAQEVFRTGEPKLLSYGIEDDVAWSVGLPCGGEIDVFVEPLE